MTFYAAKRNLILGKWILMLLEDDDEISTARWQEASEKLKIILSILVQDSEVHFFFSGLTWTNTGCVRPC